MHPESGKPTESAHPGELMAAPFMLREGYAIITSICAVSDSYPKCQLDTTCCVDATRKCVC